MDLDGIQIRYFPCPLIKRLYWAPALGRALRHEIGKLDIVHLHTVFLWPTWAAARAARSAGVPYMLSPRGMLVKDLIARRSRLAKSTGIRLIERSNVEQAAALHLTSELQKPSLHVSVGGFRDLPSFPTRLMSQFPRTGKIASDVEAIASSENGFQFKEVRESRTADHAQAFTNRRSVIEISACNLGCLHNSNTYSGLKV